jgi:F0F1-type ATP synthase membrane subunit c/vacuolar-type H+-ATPase subunit K
VSLARGGSLVVSQAASTLTEVVARQPRLAVALGGRMSRTHGLVSMSRQRATLPASMADRSRS